MENQLLIKLDGKKINMDLDRLKPIINDRLKSGELIIEYELDGVKHKEVYYRGTSEMERFLLGCFK